MLISGDFKSNEFVSTHSKRFAEAFFVCAHSKGLASVEVAESVTMSVTMSGSVAPAKLLAGFAVPLNSAAIGRRLMNTGNSKIYLGLYQLFRRVLARFAHFLCHRTSRDVSYVFPSLCEQDVCQQGLATFLRVSRSIQRRTGFVPIAITRPFGRLSFARIQSSRTLRSFANCLSLGLQRSAQSRNSKRARLKQSQPRQTGPFRILFASPRFLPAASAREFLPPPSSRCLRD